MVSIRSLAAGMAHELNNPLGIIIQGVQSIQNRLSSDIENNIIASSEVGIELDKMRSYLDKRSITHYLDGILDAGHIDHLNCCHGR